MARTPGCLLLRMTPLSCRYACEKASEVWKDRQYTKGTSKAKLLTITRRRIEAEAREQNAERALSIPLSCYGTYQLTMQASPSKKSLLRIPPMILAADIPNVR